MCVEAEMRTSECQRQCLVLRSQLLLLSQSRRWGLQRPCYIEGYQMLSQCWSFWVPPVVCLYMLLSQKMYKKWRAKPHAIAQNKDASWKLCLSIGRYLGWAHLLPWNAERYPKFAWSDSRSCGGLQHSCKWNKDHRLGWICFVLF